MKINKLLLRLLCDVILVLSAMAGFWVVTLVFAFFCAIYFEDYFEMMIGAYFVDTVSFGGGLFGVPTFLAISTVLYFVVNKMKLSVINTSRF